MLCNDQPQNFGVDALILVAQQVPKSMNLPPGHLRMRLFRISRNVLGGLGNDQQRVLHSSLHRPICGKRLRAYVADKSANPANLLPNVQ